MHLDLKSIIVIDIAVLKLNLKDLDCFTQLHLPAQMRCCNM